MPSHQLKIASLPDKPGIMTKCSTIIRTNPSQNALRGVLGGATGNRTRDTRIFSPLLYQLSYGTKLSLKLPYLSIGIAKVGIFSEPANFSS